MTASTVATSGTTIPASPARADRRLLVNTIFRGSAVSTSIGIAAYSYYFVYRAYLPLLERYAAVTEIPRPESQVDFALRQATAAGRAGLFLTFLPLQNIYITTQGPVVAYPFWEFPDIPSEGFENNPRNNWVRIARSLTLILTACEFTKQAFRRAGITGPIHVLPVPVHDRYFQLPAWDPHAAVTVGCPYWLLHNEPAGAALPSPPTDQDRQAPLPPPPRPTLAQRAKKCFQWTRTNYKVHIKPWVPQRLAVLITRSLHALIDLLTGHRPGTEPAVPAALANLQLSGAVYTTIFNPFDRRKNWTDIISAFLLALGDREDATLVLKLVVPREHEPQGVQEISNYYRSLGIAHRCRVVVIATYLTEEQITALCQGSAFYLNASKAEGACLPLQDFLAAGRPGIAPQHTALADYFDSGVGFVVASQPEPTYWPHDPRHVIRTRWNRIDWQSLHDQLRASYAAAQPAGIEDYRAMAARARSRMDQYAGLEAVWPRLVTALDSIGPASGSHAAKDSAAAPVKA